MIGKSVYLLGFLVTIAVFATAIPGPYTRNYAVNNVSHHLIVGARLPGDRLVLQQSVFKAPSWGQVVVIERVFSASRYEKITQVQALDRTYNGTGAIASILRGGPGVANVTLRFKSQRGYGINFAVNLYARR